MEVGRALFAFFCFSLLAYSECPEGSAVFFVPAVVGEGDGGELSQFSVQVKNGSGKIYTSISPKVDETTQVSQEIASFVGFRHANIAQEECDVFFGIGERAGLASVNGLSGGAGMAIGVIAALQNRSIRQDLAITGTIEPDGSIGGVGGLFEKVQAARAGGLEYLIAPRRDFFGSLFWSAVNASVVVVEAGNIAQAAEIAFSSGKIVFNGSRLEAERVPKNISRNTNGGNGTWIRALAGEMIARLNAGISEKGFGGEIGDYFAARKENADVLFEKGHYYSAANEAFLASIDLEFVSGIEGGIDAKKEMEGIRECAEGLNAQGLGLTADNWELAVGARLRESWAKNKILEVMNESQKTVEERNYLYREALYAKGWCGIAKSMAENAQNAGMAEGQDEIEKKINSWLGEKNRGGIDESLFMQMAGEMIEGGKKASAGGMADYSDAEWRAKNAEALYGQGSYLASIFDSAYASSVLDARAEAAGKESQDVQEMVEGMLSQEYSGMWAGAYAGHAKYLYEAGREENLMPAYYALKFASSLEKATRGINAKIALQGKKEGKPKATETGGFALSFDPVASGIFLALLFSIIALSYAIFLILKKKN